MRLRHICRTARKKGQMLSDKRRQDMEKYEKGYLEKPEDLDKIEQLQSVQFDILNYEGWR